jgi:hypothetical protein
VSQFLFYFPIYIYGISIFRKFSRKLGPNIYVNFCSFQKTWLAMYKEEPEPVQGQEPEPVQGQEPELEDAAHNTARIFQAFLREKNGANKI